MNLRRFALIGTPYFWLLIFFLVPFIIVVKISLSDTALAIPPYTPTLDLSGGWAGLKDFFSQLDFETFAFIGGGAVFAAFLGIVAFGGIFSLAYPRLKQKITTSVDLPPFGLTIVAALVAAVIAILMITVVAKLLVALFPALSGMTTVLDPLYVQSYLSSLKIAIISTFLTLLVAYPIAYGMAKAPEEWRATLMMLVILPFWTSFLIRVYSWMGILGKEGHLNNLLIHLGVISEPLTILNTNIAVYIGIVYTYLPFMILPIYATLEKLDGSLLEAAEDLGCTRTQAFWLVTAPLSRPGVIAGCFLVFIPALGEFVIPSLLGGSDTLMIGKVLYEEFFSNRDWPVASAVAVILLLILVIPIILFQKNQERQAEAEK